MSTTLAPAVSPSVGFAALQILEVWLLRFILCTAIIILCNFLIMWKSFGAQALLLAGFATSLVTAAASVSTTISNSQLYRFDTDGNAIDLTSDKIDYLGGAYGNATFSFTATCVA